MAEKEAGERPEPFYKIIRGTDIVDLAEAVSRSIEKGWVPVGGVAFAPPGVGDMASKPHPLMQALIKVR